MCNATFFRITYKMLSSLKNYEPESLADLAAFFEKLVKQELEYEKTLKDEKYFDTLDPIIEIQKLNANIADTLDDLNALKTYLDCMNDSEEIMANNSNVRLVYPLLTVTIDHLLDDFKKRFHRSLK